MASLIDLWSLDPSYDTHIRHELKGSRHFIINLINEEEDELNQFYNSDSSSEREKGGRNLLKVGKALE